VDKELTKAEVGLITSLLGAIGITGFRFIRLRWT